MTLDAIRALSELARVLEELGIAYAVGGSLASGAWGEPRSTHDVDLIAAIADSDVRALIERLSGRFYVDPEAVLAGLRSGRAFNLVDLELHQKLDVFPARDVLLDRAQIERAVRCELEEGGRTFPITSPELVVLRKLDWFRKGDGISERQWRDVLAVLRIQGDRLDRALMDDLAARSDLTDLLQRARGEAG